jgi:phospholipid-translocating ATPase
LLTDKTGTLTQNDMIFKKLNLEFAAFDTDTIGELQSMLVDNCTKNRDAGPMADVAGGMGTGDESRTIHIDGGASGISSTLAAQPKKRKGGLRREQSAVVRDLVSALALCHNVTPTFPDPNNRNVVEYQASSPDEVALVKFAESLDMRLMERDQHRIIIENAAKDTEVYEILANFPFSSDTKRMGIVMRHVATQRLVFYLKGAETVMKQKVQPNQRLVIEESCDDLANQGLRTLVISQKILSEEFYRDWEKRYAAAKADLNDREAKVLAAIEELESDMELLGVTGVEDRLQDNVAVVIEGLRNAGIKVWMLTGDKVETATCIAISAGFKSRQ